MSSKNPLLQKYDTIAKIYNQVWLIAIIIAAGLFVMQIATGNLSDKTEKLDISDFECYQTPDDEIVNVEKYEPQTNTDLTIIEYSQIVKTQLTINQIPPINNPKFTQEHEEVVKCLSDDEKGIVIKGENETKIYPFTILRQHLVVNDFIDDKPILVSFCALCNSPSVYERNINDKTMTFGTTGLLYRNNDLFYDDLTDSLWSQLNGNAVVGDSVGQSLTRQNFEIITVKDAVEQFPQSNILTFDTGYRRNYTDKSFEDYEQSTTIISESINTSKEFKPKDTVLAFTLEENIYAVKLTDAEIDGFSKEFEPSIDLKTINENGLIKLFINNQESEYIQAYWYVWYDYYPETIAIKP